MATNRIPLGAPQGMSTESQSARSPSPLSSYRSSETQPQSLADSGSSSANGLPPAADQSVPPPVHPDLQRPPVDAASVAVAKDELAVLREAQRQLAEIRAAQLAQQELEQFKQFKVAAKEDPTKALDAQRDLYEKKLAEERLRIDRIEQERLNERLEASLVSSVTGYRLVGDDENERMETARMLMADLRPRLEAIRRSDGQIEVREKVSGRPATDAIRELLTSKRYALFFAPTSRGGSGTDGTRAPAIQQQPDFTDFQRRQIEFIQARSASNMNQPFGLRGVPRTN